MTANRVSPAVANMSLGGGVSTALDTAVRHSIAAGVTYAIAAGNSNANAANSSPARVAEAITVGATTMTDARSSFSNFGSVRGHLRARFERSLSAWRTSDTATNTISGTSMATPHVAGVAARFLQNNTRASPATVRAELVNQATLNHLTGIPSGTANRLLFWSSTRSQRRVERRPPRTQRRIRWESLRALPSSAFNVVLSAASEAVAKRAGSRR